MSTPIASSDLTWLLMDRPNNLMHVHGLLILDELPDWDKLMSAVFDRIVTKYRVLSQIPVQRDGDWFWEDDVDFTMNRHLTRVVLDEFTDETLREYVSSQFSIAFDRNRPLWEMQLISGPTDDGTGAVLTRFHHGLGDGIRLVQLLLGTCDPSTGAAPGTVGLPGAASRGRLGTVLHVADHSVRDTIDYVQRAGAVAVEAGRNLRASINPLDLQHRFETALDLVTHPVRFIDAITSISSEGNAWANSWREIGRLVLSERADAGAWSGHPSGTKGVAWVAGLSLPAVKKAAKTYKATVNDVLLAAVSLALTQYLREQEVEEVHDLAWLMPVSLRPFDGKLPSSLGNHFAVVLLSMPLGIDDIGELVAEVHLRTSRLKHSAEPAVAFGMQQVIAEVPGSVARALTDFFSDKTIGQLTNVPGPASQLTLVGAPVRTVLGWVPTSGDQPLGVCLFTYDGTVSVGVSADLRMIRDPQRITELVQAHVESIIDSAAALPKPARKRPAPPSQPPADAPASGAASSGSEG